MPIQEINQVFERLAVEELEEEPEGKGTLQYELCDISTGSDEMMQANWEVFDYQEPEGILDGYLLAYFGRDESEQILVQVEDKLDTQGMIGVRPQVHTSYRYGLISEEQEEEFIKTVEDIGYDLVIPVD